MVWVVLTVSFFVIAIAMVIVRIFHYAC